MNSIFKKKKNQDVEIRPTIIEDAFQLTAIQKEAFEPIYKQHKDSASPYLRGPNDILNRLGQVNRHLCYTILYNGNIVGGIIIRLRGTLPFNMELDVTDCYLQRIFVAPQVQRLGIATAAIEKCFALEELSNKKTIYVDFPADLSLNKSFYESLGFVDAGRKTEVEDGLILALYQKEL